MVMKDDIASELRDLGLKLTPQRLEIVRVLKENMDDHPSLNYLHEAVKKKMPTVSFSTLFNTITTLDKAGYLTIFDLEGETRVELNMTDHINIIDRRTGEVLDIDDERIMDSIIEDLGRDRVKDKRVMINVILY